MNEVEIIFDPIRLGEILEAPPTGIDEYNWISDEHCVLTSKFFKKRVTFRAQKVLKGVMVPIHKLLLQIVRKGVLPRGHKQNITSLRDLDLMNALECKEPIDWPTVIIKHLA